MARSFLVEAERVKRAHARCLAGTGITHVLVSRGFIRHLVGRGLDEERLFQGLPEFEERCLEPLAPASAPIVIYEVRDPPDARIGGVR